ncbi:heat shock protein, Hsp20 family [Methylococcus capsulatus str. Bath]|jgi:HSP20 family protein|uniref:Heat shock protein, Hsp20 family n=2 Tax=Methylococcaceae TaxID=403 RepID=Q607M9_METCA|nr:heat shock protein, Hsp20 family [Methylococcus capsulatus str. Bath]QXP87616.1 Hsp20/alpha crystallin family protein [Methylococcus capsulatus]QXP92644.1 Hsp20/alpha crystallin family protein [Methylococcus capsulatus]
MYESLLRFPTDLFSEFDRMQQEMERMFGALGMPTSIRAVARGFPAVNIGTTPKSIEVYAFAPGIDASRLEVSVDRGLLTIAGERPSELSEVAEKVSVYADERFSGSFKRVVSLPEDVDPSGIQARYRDGVLRISVPRSEAAQPKRIEIK